jgi:hypothetical protein
MELMDVPRGAGKTTACVEWLKQSKYHVLLVANASRKSQICATFNLDQETTDRVVTPYTLDNLLGKSNFFRCKSDFFTSEAKVAIDELDDVLDIMLGMRVVLATFTQFKDRH